ncbi:MAG: S8 family serine peptidase [Acidobacteriota bacterium]
MKRRPNFLIPIVIFVCGILNPYGEYVVLSHPGDTPQLVPFTPNDPGWPLSQQWAEILGLPLTYAYQDWAEINTPQSIEDVVIVVFDQGIPSHPDLDPNRLVAYDVNISGEPYDNGARHGAGVCSIVAASVNNAIGPISVAGYRGRVKIVSAKVSKLNPITNGDEISPENIRAALEYSLRLKTEIGINVVATVFAGFTGDPDPTNELFQRMEKAGIWNFVSVRTAELPWDLDTETGTYASKARTCENVIAVGGLNTDGLTKQPKACWGSRTVKVAGVDGAKMVSYLGSQTGTAGFGNTSACSPQVAAAYALVRAYVERDPHKAWLRIELTALPLGDEEQRAAKGRLDVFAALTRPVEFPAPQLLPVVSAVNLQGDVPKKIVITFSGEKFGAVGFQLFINGEEVPTEKINWELCSDSQIVLFKGKPKKVGIKPGREFTVVVKNAAGLESLPAKFTVSF